MFTFQNAIRRTGDAPALTDFSDAAGVPVDQPALMGGGGHGASPEEFFLAAINSCQMMTLYFFAKKFGLEIQSYESDAAGVIEKSAAGALSFSSVTVKARASFAAAVTPETTAKLIGLTEKYCLVSRSLQTPVRFELEVTSA